MHKEIIFSGNTVNQVAERFASIVSRKYLESLQFWKATAMENTEEEEYWEKKIKTEPEEVKKCAYEKILKIMGGTDNPYLKRKGAFGRKVIISITRSSGFYEGLLDGKDIKCSVEPNVEYLIDQKNLSIEKRVYPAYKRL